MGIRSRLPHFGSSPQPRDYSAAHIFTDSKYAIGVLEAKWGHKSHSHIADAVTTAFCKAKERLPIHVHWTPSHCGVPGNERADRIADIFSKISASNPSNSTPNLNYIRQEHIPFSDSPPPPFPSLQENTQHKEGSPPRSIEPLLVNDSKRPHTQSHIRPFRTHAPPKPICAERDGECDCKEGGSSLPTRTEHDSVSPIHHTPTPIDPG